MPATQKEKKKVNRVAHKILKIERKKLERRVVHRLSFTTIHDKSNANEIKIPQTL